MNEYMLLIRNTINSKDGFTDELHLDFVNACKSYIHDLQQNGRLVAAQPLIREGKIIAHTGDAWSESPFNESAEVQVGYYHIRAQSLEEAVEIAKNNPEFHYTTTARIEVRPLKITEQSNQFEYPKGI